MMLDQRTVKIKALFQLVVLLCGTFSFSVIISNSVDAQQQVCCSETRGGEHCVYTDESNCAPGALQAAASCEQTSFCKLGCGFDQEEGSCFANMPRFSCEAEGTCAWSADASCDIPQCQQGCCVLSNQCSFTTQLQCKQITSQFEDINMTFEEEITSEIACINQCRSFERGACVSGDGSCTFTTREACQEENLETLNGTGPLIGFHDGRLCSNPQLGTECAGQQYTGCLPDADEVYWFDSCGNAENIYAGDKVASYNGGFTLSKEESCNPTQNNAGSPTCGNCNYALGSLCAPAERGINPTHGDYACKQLMCDADTVHVAGTAPATASLPLRNGESWCAYDGLVGISSEQAGLGLDLAGSRHYRRICVNGVELTEPCRDFREEICVQGEIDTTQNPALQQIYGTQASFGVGGGGNLIAGACRENRFLDCVDIENTEDCENHAQRDCIWIGKERERGGKDKGGRCLPLVPPGLKHWSGESATATSSVDPKATCEKGNTECTVYYHRPGLGFFEGGREWQCVGNCQCLKADYLKNSNAVCKSLGDCGAWYNIAGEYTCSGLVDNLNEQIVGVNKDINMCDDEAIQFEDLTQFGAGKSSDEGFFNEFFERSAVPLTLLGFSGIIYLTQGHSILAGIGSGLYGTGGLIGGFFSGIVEGHGFGEGFGSQFSEVYNDAIAEGIGEATKTVAVGQEFVAQGVTAIPGGTAVKLAGGTATSLAEGATVNFVDGQKYVLNDFFIGLDEIGSFDSATNIFTASEDTAFQFVEEVTLTPPADGVTIVAPDAGLTATPDMSLAGDASVELPSTPLDSGFFSSLLELVNIFLTVWTIYNLLDIFLADDKTEKITIECNPWQAPIGGDQCSLCQQDGKECSEYRCKSLGQLCKLINVGTADEKCVSSDPNDVTSPFVTVDKETIVHLTDSVDNVNQIREVRGKGFEITEQIAPFTAVSLAVETNEFAQCKYDLEHSVSFDEMAQFFGDSTYKKEHNVTFSLPGVLAEDEVLSVTNGGKYQVYIKCQDGNGNSNQADYYAKFAIAPGPDFTAPVIELTSIPSEAFVPAGVNETSLSIYTNEPATCKWDDIDTDFASMTNFFTCTQSQFPTNSIYYGLYDCITLLDGLEDGRVNTYYFKCEDQPTKPTEERNINQESYVFKLQGTYPLSITSVYPTDGVELFTASPVMKVITDGGAFGNGDAFCGYNFDDPSPLSTIDFLNSNSSVHEQPFFNLSAADYLAYINCVDLAGNLANATAEFTISVDTFAPQLSQVYTEPGILHIVTDEPSTCEYSVDGEFTYGGGIQMTGVNTEEHTASLESDTFYIACSDTFGNVGNFVIFI